jgi:hypothetical protein
MKRNQSNYILLPALQTQTTKSTNPKVTEFLVRLHVPAGTKKAMLEKIDIHRAPQAKEKKY